MADTITTTYEVGDGLKIEGDKIIVDTTDNVEKNNKKPITSRAVATEIGDLESLMGKI